MTLPSWNPVPPTIVPLAPQLMSTPKVFGSTLRAGWVEAHDVVLNVIVEREGRVQRDRLLVAAGDDISVLGTGHADAVVRGAVQDGDARGRRLHDVRGVHAAVGHQADEVADDLVVVGVCAFEADAAFEAVDVETADHVVRSVDDQTFDTVDAGTDDLDESDRIVGGGIGVDACSRLGEAVDRDAGGTVVDVRQEEGDVDGPDAAARNVEVDLDVTVGDGVGFGDGGTQRTTARIAQDGTRAVECLVGDVSGGVHRENGGLDGDGRGCRNADRGEHDRSRCEKAGGCAPKRPRPAVGNRVLLVHALLHVVLRCWWSSVRAAARTRRRIASNCSLSLSTPCRLLAAGRHGSGRSGRWFAEWGVAEGFDSAGGEGGDFVLAEL